jgi:tyrosine-protein phosphatase OCA6
MSAVTFMPPTRFARVEKTLARGAVPRSRNISFLDLQNVQTLIALTPINLYEESQKDINKDVIEFIEKRGIKYMHVPSDSSVKDKGKNREIPITHEQVIMILEVILKKDSGNVYIYCWNGGQITSLVIACLRKIQMWSSVSIFDEFVCFSESANHNDRVFVDNFIPKMVLPLKDDRVDWLWKGLNENVIINHPLLKNIQFVQS